VTEVAFWNDNLHDWDAIYQRYGPRDYISQFDMAFYPYVGNSTLLCYTLREGLGSFGTKFRISPANHLGIGNVPRRLFIPALQ
jgi:hypothetical protein